MSTVVFPFKREDPEVLLGNMRAAAEHPRVGCVVAVGFDEDPCFRAISEAAPELRRRAGTEVAVLKQERLGLYRPGKGDGMNTGLRFFLEERDDDRLHFYDADLLSFDGGWITQAEEAADQGYDLVRHYFPRASTDAMITWFITRTGFALLWPRSELPRVEQPLGGELLITRPVVEQFNADPRVHAQSDWGIDTLYTFATAAYGYSMFETYVSAGKIHRLYGALTDLRTMLVECFAALQGLAGERLADHATHHIAYQGPVKEDVKRKIGYAFDDTLALLAADWTDRQLELLQAFPKAVREGMEACRRWPRVGFMDEDAWYDAYRVLLRAFERDDADWQALLFRLWVARVLAYTVTVALQGYDAAMDYLHGMVDRYLRRAALEL